jgi:hypothetical protein
MRKTLRWGKETFFGSLILGFVGIHTAEDVLLLSIGKYLPVPTLWMYAIGLGTSWIVMSLLVKWFGVHHGSHH